MAETTTPLIRLLAHPPRERPILFSDPMVRAILEGRKTQTRRVVRPQPEFFPQGGRVSWRHGNRIGSGKNESAWGWHAIDRCPYGRPGDRLYVREAWALVPRTAYAGSAGVVQTLRPDDAHDAAVYRAGWDRSRPGRWRPSIHMPRWASRLTLEVTDVRVERVQDIGEEDARAEGLYVESGRGGSRYHYSQSAPPRSWYTHASDAFRRLWDDTMHTKGGTHDAYGWDANPWVWAITFRVVENAGVTPAESPEAAPASEVSGDGWRSDLPPAPGWFDADFGEVSIHRVWLAPVPAEGDDEEDGIVWSWRPTDDPEAVELECAPGHTFRWREAPRG